MTTKVFIAGSMNIKNLAPQVTERLEEIVARHHDVVVGDADGVDTSIQWHLFNRGVLNATVYCSGPAPRNNVGDWPVVTVQTKHAEGTRAFFTAKDVKMAEASDVGLMIWDARSTGTLSNVIELLSRHKKALVFVNKEKAFKKVGNIEELEALVNCMSEHAKRKADEKIRLFDRIESLKQAQVQTQMFA